MVEIIKQIFRVSSLGKMATTFVFLFLSFAPLSSNSSQIAGKTNSNLNPIQRENQLPGTTDWQLSNPSVYDDKMFHYSGIEGYAWETSVEAGQAVNFSVSTPTPSFSAAVYRMGWYQGKGGRLIRSIPTMPGYLYSVPSPQAGTRLVEANWPLTFTLQTDTQWVSGVYMVKLTASDGQQSYISFVLRSPEAAHFAFIHAVNTDEAYNFWGGTSLYTDLTHKSKDQRAFKVSFDRPFEQDNGAGLFFWFEYPMVRWLEQNGYDISYLSDPDLETTPSLLQKYQAVLVVGHNEYWSKQMRDTLTEAVNQGVNLAVFGANTLYWQIRYEPRIFNNQSFPDRVIVCYKNQVADPLYKKENALVTVQSRGDPLNNAEQSLLGSMWAGQWEPDKGGFPWVVADASSWVFAGTGLKNGDGLPGLVGYEYDRVDPDYPLPRGVEILAASPVVNEINGKQDTANATLYTATSGAQVFNAGTFEWSWGLDNSSSIEKFWSPGNKSPHPSLVNKAAQKITANILENFLGTDHAFRTRIPIMKPYNLQGLLPYAFVILGILYLVFCYWVWLKMSAIAKKSKAQRVSEEDIS